MFHILFNLFWKKSKKEQEEKEQQGKEIKSGSGYVYTDYKAKMREAEEKKRQKKQNS